MSGVLVVTHGNLASELVSAAEKIAGERGRIHALCLDWNDGIDLGRERLRAAIGKADDGRGVLVLTDMFGDTPSNAALALIEPGRVEMISGVNLPMVVRLACGGATDQAVTELANWLVVKGRKSICRAGGPDEESGVEQVRKNG